MEKEAYGNTDKEQNVHTLKYSRRFGPINCRFLRETCKEYGEKTPGVWSPMDLCAQDVFTESDKAGVPDTYLRFVTYRGEVFFFCQDRGEMLPASRTKKATAGRLEAHALDESRYTVAGSVCIVANMYHEALCLLRGLCDGHIRLNADSEPLTLTSDTEAVATMIYLNDVLINVDAGIIAILGCEAI